MMTYFETTKRIDKNTFDELRKHLVKTSDRRLYLLMASFCFILSLANLAIYRYSGVAITFGVGLVLLAVFRSLPKTIMRVNFGRKFDVNKTTFDLNVTLTDEGIFFIRSDKSAQAEQDDALQLPQLTTKYEGQLDYSAIRRFVETPNCYTLMNKENRLVVLNKTALAQAGQDADFITFVKERCQNINWPPTR